jgi:Protein of unknown function (DUF2795)
VAKVAKIEEIGSKTGDRRLKKITSYQGGTMAKANPIQVQKFLSGMHYPADKDEIVNHAKKQGADDNIMQTLEQLPDESFETPADVSKAIGQIE